jgi:putative SOS response-associated peptidase YedK
MQKYEERYKHALPADIEKRSPIGDLPTYYFVSGFSHPPLPLVTSSGIQMAQWGLIPFWIKDKKTAMEIRGKTLNAVSETIFEKPSFRHRIQTGRALLGVRGFFEWRSVHGKKYPYFIQFKNTEIFSLGCIYDLWTDKETGEITQSFSILTTAANKLMEQIHSEKKRMPVIISVEHEKHWLDKTLKTSDLNDFFKPFTAEAMSAYTVSTELNSAKNNRNTPEALMEVDYGISNFTL